MIEQQQFIASFMQKEQRRFKLKTGVLLLLVQDDQLLLSRRYQTGIDDGLYVVPMGCHDGRETLTDALIREAKEEIGIMLAPQDIQVCHVMHRLHHMPVKELSFEQMDVFFKVQSFSGTIRNMEPEKCDELAFYPLNNLPDKVVPFIRQAITCVQTQQFYSEFGW